MPRGILFVVSGPSGVGKNTVLNSLLAQCPNLHYSISATTRQPRPGELDGINYYFHTIESFKAGIEAGSFLEWAEIYGQYYGTPRNSVERWLTQGDHVILDIDIQGAAQIRRNCPEAVLIFLYPPSLEELKRRLIERKTETEEAIKKRLAYVQAELASVEKYDYVVVNDQVSQACQRVSAIISAEECRLHRRYWQKANENFNL